MGVEMGTSQYKQLEQQVLKELKGNLIFNTIDRQLEERLSNKGKETLMKAFYLIEIGFTSSRFSQNASESMLLEAVLGLCLPLLEKGECSEVIRLQKLLLT